VVAAWQDLLAEAAVDWVPTEEGAQYVGVDGHSGRRSGAKLLVRCGWTREAVAFLGRWGSDAIMAYIEEVTMVDQAFDLQAPGPLEADARPPPQVVVAAEREPSPADKREDLSSELKALGTELGLLRASVKSSRKTGRQALSEAELVRAGTAGLHQTLSTLQEEIALLPSWERLEVKLKDFMRGPAYVRARGSKKYHRVASAHPLSPAEDHETRCGWSFGPSQGVQRFDAEPPGLAQCDRGCF
jgi:hypothetical protein